MNPTTTPDAGIPTMYRGVEFRGRAEARWAVMFDHFRWNWSYEPVDGPAGYIPDFLLHGQAPVFVEIKGGATTVDSLRDEAAALVPRVTGLPHPVVVLGADLGLMPTVGIHVGSGDHVAFAECQCGRVALTTAKRCRPCGDETGFDLIDRVELAPTWAFACNVTKWRRAG